MVGGMQVGAVTIEGVSDGSLPVPPTPLFNKSDQDWLQHSQFLDDDGMLPIEIGGFLVRSGEHLVLVDTGIGPDAVPERTGMFMRNLDAHGVRPSEITDVVLTHLHFDHLGWATDGERRLFDKATYRCHEADWKFMGTDPFDDSQAVSVLGGRTSWELLPPILERLETWSEDRTILPGIDVRSAPGHTPGSTVIVISSGMGQPCFSADRRPLSRRAPDRRLGDDRRRRQTARAADRGEALARELESSDIPAAATHFPGS